MVHYLIRRLIYMIVVLFAVSVVSFIIIQLPPGDYLNTVIMRMKERGEQVDYEAVEAMRVQYGLDRPLYAQYFFWMGNVLQGDLGRSFEWNRPVADLLRERIGMTIMLSLFTLLFTYAISIPIGIYSATHQYSAGDYLATFFGFVGLAIPNFLLALILMFLFYRYFDVHVGGLFSSDMVRAPWSLAKVWDMLTHLPIPIIVIGSAGTANLIRVLRGCLLDELKKQYVVTARAKGLKERKLIYKYPVRVAINPLISTIGWTLTGIVSGEAITATVLGLPTTGQLLVQAMLSQDMYLAGSIVFFLAGLTVVGTLISDVLLVLVDPRIRYEKKA